MMTGFNAKGVICNTDSDLANVATWIGWMEDLVIECGSVAARVNERKKSEAREWSLESRDDEFGDRLFALIRIQNNLAIDLNFTVRLVIR